MASNVVKKLGDEFLNCAVCRATYKEPKMLPCIHSFCKNCLQECHNAAQIKGDRFGCPICRTSITLPNGGIDALPTNFLLQSLHDKLGEIGTNEAKSSSRTKPKTTRPKIVRQMSRTRCDKHTNGLSMYCRTCKAFQCMICTSSNDHKGHDLVDATEAELDVHETIEFQAVLLESVQEHARCGDTEERARGALQRVKREAASAEDSITQRAAEAVERIEAEKVALLSRLRMTEARKTRLISRVLDSAEKSKTRCKEIQNSVKDALESGDSAASESNSLSSKLDELRIETEDLELDSSLTGLGLEFEPSNVDNFVGRLHDPSKKDESTTSLTNGTTNAQVSQPNGNYHAYEHTIHTMVPSASSEESVLDDGTETSSSDGHNSVTLEETLDALVNDTLQSPVEAEVPDWYMHPSPPWHHHPPHHRPHHPLHHPPHHPPPHPHHPFHPPPHHHFGPRMGHHRGMRHCPPFRGGRGRAGRQCHTAL